MLTAGPVLSNGEARQRMDGSMLVDITYDLAGEKTEEAVIYVEVSPDGGATWKVPGNLSGDYGMGIQAGTKRHIVWNAGEEAPNEYWLNCLLKFNVPLELMKISAGTFMMGSPANEKDRQDNEGPHHKVVIGYDFYLAKNPVTKIQWEAMMGTTPWDGQNYVLDDPDSPAVYISWDDIREENGMD